MKISAWLTGTYFVVDLGVRLWIGWTAVTSGAFRIFSALGGALVAILRAAIQNVHEIRATP